MLTAGVSRELAKRRADKFQRLTYTIEFDLVDGMDFAEGSVRILFACTKPDEDLVLDWGGEQLRSLSINGRELDATKYRRIANHVVIAAEHVVGGKNSIEASFRSRVAATGTPLTSYRDTTDGKNYYYTLVVPADCHRLFPCFDQPDVKAIFGLDLRVPEAWEAVTNEPPIGQPTKLDGARKQIRFDGTAPISTYLFAFAAGPFSVVEGPTIEFGDGSSSDRRHPIRTFVRSNKRDQLQAERVVKMHLDSLRWYEKRFATPYPFDKLDIVLCPGFPYGGMEHAGAIFYRESAIVFDHAPTENEELRRSTLIYHEVAHQWFGNLVTMRWFDELWLKEGFATWASFAVLDELEPDRKAWLRFHQSVKPSAYAIDASNGTVPVFQQLGNLADAKSAYGPIVYNKAPAVLRELESRLGSDLFYEGVSIFLREHRYGNATWTDLVAALGRAGATDLDTWSRRWIESPGMPQLRLEWSTDTSGRVEACTIKQRSAQGWLTEPWPLRVEILIGRKDAEPRRIPVVVDNHAVRITELESEPAWVLLNSNDAAYGQFVPDSKSARALAHALATADKSLATPLLRALAFRALIEATREAELDPSILVETGLSVLETERDPITFRQTLATTSGTISRYLSGAQQKTARARLESYLRELLSNGLSDGIELVALRSFARVAKTEESLALLRALASGTRSVTGLELGPQDRFLCAAAIVATGDTSLVDELERKATTDVAKYAYQARAADPSAEAKKRVFATFLQESEPPEQWISGSLDFFHWPGQEERTLPFLEPALDAILWVKKTRKIFFMPAWIDSFINAHNSPEALRIVDEFLAARKDLPIDVRRKILQSVDRLRRAVRVREKFGPK